MQYNGTIVFDVDDTICSNERRTGYKDCVPSLTMIDKINNIHDVLGFKVILYTSRGMKSCGNDVDKAIAKNKEILEDWLDKYDVHYDELVFGKPFADLYVDDKAITPSVFLDKDFCVLNGGGSGKRLYRLGPIVKKCFEDNAEIERLKDWYNEDMMFNKPSMLSSTNDAVYMEYIDGENLVDCCTFGDVCMIIRKILLESSHVYQFTDFNIDNHISILKKNYCEHNQSFFSGVHNYRLDKCIEFLDKNRNTFSLHASVCHGDMILSNVIVKDNDLYFIDPQYFRKESSYLLDFAKLRMSLSGYEKEFGLTKRDYSVYKKDLDDVLKERGIFDLVVWLQLMYTIRLFRYKDNKQKVINLEERLVKENGDVLKGL